MYYPQFAHEKTESEVVFFTPSQPSFIGGRCCVVDGRVAEIVQNTSVTGSPHFL